MEIRTNDEFFTILDHYVGHIIVVETAKAGYSAPLPDLPGCVATGSTRPRVVSRMQSAIRFHRERMREERQRVPSPKSFTTYVGIPQVMGSFGGTFANAGAAESPRSSCSES